MKFDLNKIINIKNKSDLDKFNDEPLFYNNYLFHYLIIFNKLDILKLKKFPIYKENDEEMNGFFLASKYNNIKILKYLIRNYKEYIYNKNNKNELFINYLDYNSILKIIHFNLDWNILLKNKLDDLFINLNYNNMLILLNKYKPNDCCLHMIINNNNLNINEIIKILNLFSINQLKLKDHEDKSLIFPALNRNNIKLIEYLIDKNIDINYYTIHYTFNPLKKAFILDFFDAYDLIWKNIKNNFNYELTNKNLDNIAHFLLINHFTDNTSFDIINNCPSSVWHQYNIKKKIPLELILSYDFDKYGYLLKNKNINLKYIKNYKKFENSENKNIIKWIKFLKKLPLYNENNENIIVNEYPYFHYNLFKSNFKNVVLYLLYLKKKYKNLYYPNLIDYKINNIDNIENINIDTDFDWPDDLLNIKPIFPWIICYKNEYEYWIHSELNNLINEKRREKKYDFAICYLSVDINVLHANILVYDFNNLTIERFDPYGDDNLDGIIDEILEEELTWNTGFTYLKPSNFMPVSGFQTISDETKMSKQKVGDFGGYCLAWCLWFLEHRIINIHVKSSVLVKKLLNILSKSKYSFIEYIRNYANKLYEHQIKYLQKIGIELNNISNTYFSKNDNNKINKYIIEYHLPKK